MKKTIMMTIAFTIFFSVQLLIPNKSEAQITCSTDFYGNTWCIDSQSSNSSTTSTDFYENDNTSFNDGGTMGCRTDF